MPVRNVVTCAFAARPAPASTFATATSAACVDAFARSPRAAKSGDERCTENWRPRGQPDRALVSDPMSAYRSSGALASILSTTASSCGLISGRDARGDGGNGTLRCMLTSSPKPSDTNGVCPMSIS